jgi:hypothetical protein
MPIILATQEAEIRKDQGSKPAWANRVVSKTLSQKKKITKNSWWSGSMCRPLFQAPVLQKKKKSYLSNE